MANAPHHSDARYRRLAAAVRSAAYSDGSTRCARCGKTLDEGRLSHPRATWDAGHVIDGDLSAGLVAEHSSCNRSAGARAGNAKRGSGYDW